MKRILYLSRLFCLSVFIVFIICPASGIYGQNISTYAGTGLIGYTGDGGPATNATLDSSTSLATDIYGNLYINDQRNYCVRKVSPTGIITTIAGTGAKGYNGDNIPATNAKLDDNWAIAVDNKGNLYISDQSNYRIRKVSGGIISTIAGTGTTGYGGDNGAATLANIGPPFGIATDVNGNIFFSDLNNRRIRKVDTFGIISTYAGMGTAGSLGDNGPATLARLGSPLGIASDEAGNLFVCDGLSNKIRKITNSGIITTFAGNGVRGFGGDGVAATLAQLNQPTGIYASRNGDIYITDLQNNRVRKVNNAGIISTIAGSSVYGFAGDGGPAAAAQLNRPIAVTMDETDNIYLSDMINVRIRKISTLKRLYFTQGRFQTLPVCYNDTGKSINSLLAIADFDPGNNDTWSVAAPPKHGMLDVTYNAISTGGTITPVGLYYRPVTGYVGNDTFLVKVTNGSYTDITTVYVTVIPLLTSAGVITGPASVCEDGTIKLTDTVGRGIWSVTNGRALINTTGTVRGVEPGIDTIIYTVHNLCSSVTTSHEVLINPKPDPGKITGSSSVCIGYTTDLFDSVSGGSWSMVFGNVNVSPIPGGCRLTGVSVGVDTVKYTISNSFCTAIAVHPLAIDTSPYAGYIVGDTVVCIGSEINLFDHRDGGVWTTSAPNVQLFTDNHNCIVRSLATGSVVVGYKIVNACGVDIAEKHINVAPLPDPPVINHDKFLLTTTYLYTAYQWSLNGAFIPGAIYDSLIVFSPGTYAVTIANDAGCKAKSEPVFCDGCKPEDINIYPNPASNIVYVDWCKPVFVKLLTEDGRTVIKAKGVNAIDVGNLPNATYYLNIIDENNKTIASKCIIKL